MDTKRGIASMVYKIFDKTSASLSGKYAGVNTQSQSKGHMQITSS